MHHFFVENSAVEDGRIRLQGSNYDHAVNVLRLREGEGILISDSAGNDYECSVESVSREAGHGVLTALIRETGYMTHELPSSVWLFQSLPKSDRMEFIIQKAVELGADHVVPVMSRNCVMKLDPKKAAQKLKRWQAVAESAAKQSQRSVIPEIHSPVQFTEAVHMAEELDVKIIPYENAKGLDSLCESIISFIPGRSVGVFIGPEGGYDPLEIRFAENRGIVPVSLGGRILRTETAAVAALSLVMIRLEIAAGTDLSDV